MKTIVIARSAATKQSRVTSTCSGLLRVALTRSLDREEAGTGVRATAICPGFVDTPMAEWTGIPGREMIQPEDCAELVRALLRLSPYARIPVVVIERTGGEGVG